jgi:LemA protein
MEIILAVGALALIVIVLLYNGLISKKNEIENAEGGLDASLKQRYDLIPNLVAAVKEFMGHEKALLMQVTELRTKALTPGISHEEKQSLNKSIADGLGKIVVTMENYPELKSNTNVLQLQKSLQDCEENIAASRRFFNSAVTTYNNALEMFPSNIMASLMKLQRRKTFEIPDVERQPVSVKALFS